MEMFLMGSSLKLVICCLRIELVVLVGRFLVGFLFLYIGYGWSIRIWSNELYERIVYIFVIS